MAKAVRYYEKKLERKVPESTVRRFKNFYRVALKRKLEDVGMGGEVPQSTQYRRNPVDNQLSKIKLDQSFAAEVKKQLDNGVPLQNIKVNISMSNIKGVSASWILSAVDYISNNPYICVNGFRLAGLIRCLC